jgi:hypothetical protein
MNDHTSWTGDDLAGIELRAMMPGNLISRSMIVARNCQAVSRIGAR